MIRLQQITGFLNHICKAVFPARAHIRWYYAKAVGKKQYHHVNVDQEMKQDTKMWLTFLNKDPLGVCRPFVDLSRALIADEIEFFSDASGAVHNGIGCLFKDAWSFAFWEEHVILQKQPSTEYLELYAVMIAIFLWAKDLANRRVIIFCDNMSIGHCINKSTSSCPNCVILLRIITATSLKYNVRFFCRHVIGHTNTLVDELSRGKIDQYWKEVRKLGKKMKSQPVPMPEDYWPPSKLWKDFNK